MVQAHMNPEFLNMSLSAIKRSSKLPPTSHQDAGPKEGAAANAPAPPPGEGAQNAEQPAQPPPPSFWNAIWLVITFVNFVLFLFIIPESLFKDERIELIVKAGSFLVTIFVGGFLWLKTRFFDFLGRTAFKVSQSALLGVLVTLHLSQFSLFPIYPAIKPADATLKVDGAPVKYDGKRLRLPISDHKITIGNAEEENEREFSVSYKDVLFSMFKGYRPSWSLLYNVKLSISDAKVEVVIRKLDGEFDDDYREKREPTTLGQPFKQTAKDTFVYLSKDEPLGSTDNIRLPYGDYEFTARRQGCKTDMKTLSIGQDQSSEYEVNFDVLCEAHP